MRLAVALAALLAVSLAMPQKRLLTDLTDLTGDLTDLTDLLQLTGAIKDVTGALAKRDLKNDLQDLQKAMDVYNEIARLLKKRGIDAAHEVQDFGLEDVTGAIKGVTGYLADIASTIGPALNAISLGKREIPAELQDTDWNQVLEDVKGIGHDLASIFANVGPAVAGALGRRDADVQDFGLEDVTGAIKGVTGYLADIASTIGPALNAISLGKRDAPQVHIPTELQDTDWNKVLEDVKGIGQDLANIFANVGPAIAGAVGKRDAALSDSDKLLIQSALQKLTPEQINNIYTELQKLNADSVATRAVSQNVQDTDWDQVLSDVKGIASDLGSILLSVGPAIAAATLG